MLFAIAFLIAGAAFTVRVVRRPTRVGALAIVVLALAWLPIDHQAEGPVLLTLSESHGVTTADLASVLAVVVAAWVWRAARHRGSLSPSSRQPPSPRLQRMERDSQGR